MTINEAIKIIENEKECVQRDCNRDCANCELVKEENEIVEAFDIALACLKNSSKTAELEYVCYQSVPKIGNYHCSNCRAIIPIDYKDSVKYCFKCGSKFVYEQ